MTLWDRPVLDLARVVQLFAANRDSIRLTFRARCPPQETGNRSGAPDGTRMDQHVRKLTSAILQKDP
jgi:hypothetical protein